MTTQIPEPESHPLGAQVLQFTWESFGVDLNAIVRAPKQQRERRILDAALNFESSLRRLGFTEAQAQEFRALYIESLRSYLEQPFREPGVRQ